MTPFRAIYTDGHRIRPVLRLVCWLRGHVNCAWMLPEDEFGLYAFSRLFCSRCEYTFARREVAR